MDKIIKCYGCGAVIQSDHVNKIGYVPKNAHNSDEVLCQRCFKMKNYHQLSKSPLEADDFLKLLKTIAASDGLIVYMLDLFDFDGSKIKGITRHLKGHDFLVVVNKRDVLPKSVKSGRFISWIKKELKEDGIKPLDVLLTSCRNKFQLEDVFGAIEHFRNGKNVYVVGTTNVGKSTFINQLIGAYSDSDKLVTTSEFPGTTLDMIEIPLGDGTFIYDTPGIINHHQLTHYIAEKDLKMVIPSNEIKQKVYQLNPKQSIFVGGLARLDFISGDRCSVIGFFSNRLELHRTKMENADALYNRHQTLKIEPLNYPLMSDFKRHEFHLKNERVDLFISGLGWFSMNATNQHFAIYVPQNVAVYVRKNLI